MICDGGTALHSTLVPHLFKVCASHDASVKYLVSVGGEGGEEFPVTHSAVVSMFVDEFLQTTKRGAIKELERKFAGRWSRPEWM